MQKKLIALLISGAAIGLNGCSSSSDSDTSSAKAQFLANLNVPSTYNFVSRFNAGEESARYSGQVARQVLITDLNTEINSKLEERITAGTWNSDTTKAEVLEVLNSYFVSGTNAIGDNPILLNTTPATAQTTYNDISTDKKLIDKLAGNDASTDHKDWDNGGFTGWTIASPQALIEAWFDMIAENTVTAANGTARSYDDTGETLKIYHTEDGLDLKQLVQKFLLVAITFSQGVDDYLDDATDGKGLLTDNTQPAGTGSAFTQLEHQFDEGFGYFGAARDYLSYTDAEIASSSSYKDSNADGEIDLNAEINFALSTNAAKRDLGSTTGTNFTQDAMQAFLTGRAIIARAGDDGDGALTDLEMEVLKEQRDIAVAAWEKAISATAVHYINDTLSDMDKADADDGSYSYLDHTKHWAEMKGFALGLQFNPRSPMHEGTRLADFNTLVGERPTLPGEAGFADYRQALLNARDILQEAYDFAQADVENW
jgi:hypothetical protein